MNIENATNVLFRLTSFFPADLLVDIIADKNATAATISNTENKTVFSIVYKDERTNKRIVTVMMQAKNKDNDDRFHRYMIDISYDGNGKVYSSLCSAEAYAELISVLFPCENVASDDTSQSQVLDINSETHTMNKLQSLADKYCTKVNESFDSKDISILARISKLLDAKRVNVLSRLTKVESAIKSGLQAFSVVLVDAALNRCIIAHKTFYALSRFDAKRAMIAQNKALLDEVSSLVVMAY